MGMYTTLRFGPFFRCTTHGKKTEKVKSHYCPKNHHKNNLMLNHNFCPTCGEPLKKEIEIVDLPVVNRGTVWEALLENLGSEDIVYEGRGECMEAFLHYWFPNHHRGENFFGANIAGEDTVLIFSEIRPTPEEQKEWLANNYKDVLEVLEKLYDNVEIEFGIIGGYS